MLRKIFGFLFFAPALLLIISNITTGSLFDDRGSAVATYGYFLGQMIPIIVYILSGIYFLTFDGAYTMNYVDGFKARGKQNKIILPCLIIYAILTVLSMINNILTISPMGYMITVCMFFLPFYLFAYMLSTYLAPYNKSKKFFVYNDEMIQSYLSTNEVFTSCSQDNSVLASKKALFFPRLFCIVPFDQIQSVKPKKELGIKYVYFYLNNGKKFYVTTKYYSEILAAIEENKQAQQ